MESVASSKACTRGEGQGEKKKSCAAHSSRREGDLRGKITFQTGPSTARKTVARMGREGKFCGKGEINKKKREKKVKARKSKIFWRLRRRNSVIREIGDPQRNQGREGENNRRRWGLLLGT